MGHLGTRRCERNCSVFVFLAAQEWPLHHCLEWKLSFLLAEFQDVFIHSVTETPLKIAGFGTSRRS